MRLCTVNNCNERYRVNGCCNRHALQMRRNGKITVNVPITNEPGEEWKEIVELKGAYQERTGWNVPGFVNHRYEISNHGRVKSFRFDCEKIMKPQLSSKYGTYNVMCGTGKLIRIHALVAKYFIPNPYNSRTVVFLDGNKENPRADNLTWKTTLENRQKSLNSLQKQAVLGCPKASSCVAYMNGDTQALNSILEEILTYYRDLHDAGREVDLTVVQDSIIKAVSAIDRGLLHDTRGFNAWISRIIRNTLINKRNREMRTKYLIAK